MKMGSSLWRWKHSLRRNPWPLLIPGLVLAGVVLVFLIKLLVWAFLASSALFWLLLGAGLGLGLSSLLYGKSSRGRGKKWKGTR